MAFKCSSCEEMFDGDADYYPIVICQFDTLPPNGVEVKVGRRDELCDNCATEESFYCHFTDERYSLAAFSYGDDEDGNTVCIEAVDVAGWVYDAAHGYYRPCNKEESTMATGKYVDFYWHLENGERHGMLQLDGGAEEPMPPELEKKIYRRIAQNGGDDGDPQVVNTYTRLQLIDDKVLPEDYVL